MAAAIPIVAILGTVVSAVGTYKNAQAKKDVLKEQAEQAHVASEQKAQDYEKRAKAALSTEVARRGASGIKMEGSPLLTYYENARTFKEDTERIRQGGDVEAEGLRRSADLEEKEGKLRVGKTILTGATDVFGRGQEVGWW